MPDLELWISIIRRDKSQIQVLLLDLEEEKDKLYLIFHNFQNKNKMK